MATYTDSVPAAELFSPFSERTARLGRAQLDRILRDCAALDAVEVQHAEANARYYQRLAELDQRYTYTGHDQHDAKLRELEAVCLGLEYQMAQLERRLGGRA